jgi:hypothetical protein
MKHLSSLMTATLVPIPIPDFPAFNHACAKREGWRITVAPTGSGRERYRLDPHPESLTVKSPEQAWGVVIRTAQSGGTLHTDTLRFLRRSAPDEWRLICQYASAAMGIDLPTLI